MITKVSIKHLHWNEPNIDGFVANHPELEIIKIATEFETEYPIFEVERPNDDRKLRFAVEDRCWIFEVEKKLP